MNRGSKKLSPHIPQNGQKLRDLREKIDATQAEMADKLTNPLKPYMGTGFVIQQSDISRLEREETALDIPRLLAYAQSFNIDIGVLLKPHFQTLCTSEIRWQRFATNEKADAYLCQLESQGRLLAYSQFPSSFFSTARDTPRFQQIAQADYADTEIYTIDAFLNFLFSPISYYSNAEKIQILHKYLNYFRSSSVKHIRFFSRSEFPNMSRFSNLELLKEKSTLIMLAPIMQQNQGDVFLEVNSPTICEEVYDFYQFQVRKLDDHIAFIKIGIETLELMQQDTPLETAVLFFYREVCKRSNDESLIIRENFSPDWQQRLMMQT
ncbi:MAG: hypothetical protein RI964_2803 [Pseudomonadota bacterium]|jgi:transcriptional regulator with XRE-family HTH domain